MDLNAPTENDRRALRGLMVLALYAAFGMSVYPLMFSWYDMYAEFGAKNYYAALASTLSSTPQMVMIAALFHVFDRLQRGQGALFFYSTVGALAMTVFAAVSAPVLWFLLE